MRLHRFYTSRAIREGEINSLPDMAQILQIKKVLRLHAGDHVVIFDGSGEEYDSEIVTLTDEKLEFRTTSSRNITPQAKRKISLAFSLIKKDNIEWILQKCTELGVSEFIPVISERSEKKGFNMDRANKIIIEACEQSGRGDIPRIMEPMKLADFLESEKRSVFAFHMSGKSLSKASLASHTIVACIGPEGGWTLNEIELFKKKGAAIVSIDTPILRAETAAIAVSTLLIIL
jgi:16S rRNA (uracil1498-N3)-methyltransferase